MKEATLDNDWQSAIERTYETFSLQIIDYIPQLIGAIALLIGGWLIASFCRVMARKSIRGFDNLVQKAARKRGIERPPSRSYAELIGNIVFWVILIFFLSASAQLLGWEIFSNAMSSLLGHLPNILTGIAIILAGFGFSGFLKSTVANAAASTGIAQPEIIGRIAQSALVLLAIIVGIEHLGISVTFVTNALIVAVGVCLGGLALAFGMGAQLFIANVLGAQASRKHFQLGQLVCIGDTKGYVLEITSTTIILNTESGRTAIPAKFFHESITSVVDESHETKPEGGNNA